MTQAKQKELAALFAMWFVWLIAVGVTATYFYLYRQYVSAVGMTALAQSWPTIEAKVLESSIDAYKPRKHRVSYRVKARYEYVIDGRTYSSRTLSFFGDPTFHAADVAEIAMPKVGQTLAVKVSPDSHTLSVVDVTRSDESNFLLKYGGLCLWTASGVLVAVAWILISKRDKLGPLLASAPVPKSDYPLSGR